MHHHERAGARRSPWKGVLKRALAVGAASSISVGAYALPAAASVDNYPDQPAESAASVVDASLLDTGIAGGGRSEATWDANPGPNNEALNVDVLGSELIQLGNIELPATDLIDFGQMGALQSESGASSPMDAYAVSGLASGDGSVTLDGADADFGAAEVDLLSLFSEAGVDSVTEDLISEATLRLGAGGAEVIAEDGQFLDQDGVGGAGQYRVGEATALVTSPQVSEAADMIYDTVGELDATAESIVNDQLDISALTDALPGDTSLDVTIDSNMQEEIFQAIVAEPITTNNEVLTVDFSTGQAQVHLDQLLSGELRPDQPTGMNNQNPNTELIDDELYPMIAETVHDLMEEVTNIAIGAVEGALGSITVNFEATADSPLGGSATASWAVNLMDEEVQPFECTAEGVDGEVACATLQTAYSTLSPLIDGVLAPVRDFLIGDAGQQLFDTAIGDIKTDSITVPIREALEPFIEALTNVVSLQLNHQETTQCTLPDGTETTGSLEVSALSLGLASAVDGARLNIGSAGARIDACGEFSAIDPAVTVDPAEVPAGDSTTVDGTGYTPDSTATIQLQDADGNAVGDPIEGVATDADGNFTQELPVPEGTTPGDYTVVVTDDETGESSNTALTVTEPDATIDPAVTADPAEVPAGDSTTVDGTGYTPDSTATIQLQDADGNPVGDPIEGVATDPEGALTEELPVPADATPGDYTIVVTDDTTDESAQTSLTVTEGDGEDGAETDPSVTVDPTEVTPGDSTTVEGSDYTPDNTVTIELVDDEGNPVGESIEAPTDENGNFTEELPVPEGTEPGDYTVVVTDDETDESAEAPLVVVEFAPSLSAEPQSVPNGEDVTVMGEGYVPGSTVKVEFAAPESQDEVYETLEGVDVSEDGTFEVTWTVEGVQPSALFITATDESDPNISSRTAVSVPPGQSTETEDPILTVDPNQAAPGDTVTIDGEQFAPGTTVTVDVEDIDGNVLDTIEDVQVGDDGTFTHEWEVPEGIDPSACDVVVLTATDSEGNSATSVLCVEEASSELSISIEHEVITHGETQVGHASGYEPGEEVSGFMNSTPSLELGTQTADDEGTVTFEWEIPAEAEVADHTFSTSAEGYEDQSVGFEVVTSGSGSDESGSGEDGSGTIGFGTSGSGTSGSGDSGSGDSDSSDASGDTGDLADTGANGVIALAVLASLALIAGAGAVAFVRHRRNAA
ncbi:choice-of-anchor G family protein [Nesterenkonia sp. F]|uniref:choice-of-anchor G family protein n=1 Tax=Nesterenkonia sp. F TaxID=795955 RepID=UPI001303C506|nr:choice-of-anchor G family protein [Nesterenkonia sp. F]